MRRNGWNEGVSHKNKSVPQKRICSTLQLIEKTFSTSWIPDRRTPGPVLFQWRGCPAAGRRRLTRQSTPRRIAVPDRTSVLDGDRAHRAAVPGRLGVRQQLLRHRAPVGQTIVPHGEHLRACSAAQSASDARLIYRGLHLAASLLSESQS